MPHKQLNNLPKEDPLFHYLSHEILPRHFHPIQHPEFHVFRLHVSSHNNKVYLYEEKSSQVKFVGKFFVDNDTESRGSQLAHREFQNLMLLQNYHLNCAPHRVIKPIAYSEYFNRLLLEEYASGQSLCKVIRHALSTNKFDNLYSKLSTLAYFLSALHNKTTNGQRVDFHRDCTYFYTLLNQLKTSKGISEEDSKYFERLCENWKNKPCMWEDNQVIVHGDATPPNFIFGKDGELIAIDFERMKYADRIFDLGRIVGEMQHYFMRDDRSKMDAEPFIGHFLWEYCRNFPSQPNAFYAITKRLPFQIAITLMRIARNSWTAHHHSHHLIHEAKRTLKDNQHAN